MDDDANRKTTRRDCAVHEGRVSIGGVFLVTAGTLYRRFGTLSVSVCRGKTPRSKLQAPGKLQFPNSKKRARALELGNWSFPGDWSL